MRLINTLFALFVMCVMSYGQQGPTSGGLLNTTQAYSHTHTIGEVFITESSNNEYSAKNGIIQYFDDMGTYTFDPAIVAIKIYPNPASDHIFFDVSEIEFTQYKIFDIDSKLVRSGTLDGDKISLNGIISGAYILQLRSVDDLVSQLFIKQ